MIIDHSFIMHKKLLWCGAPEVGIDASYRAGGGTDVHASFCEKYMSVRSSAFTKISNTTGIMIHTQLGLV